MLAMYCTDRLTRLFTNILLRSSCRSTKATTFCEKKKNQSNEILEVLCSWRDDLDRQPHFFSTTKVRISVIFMKIRQTKVFYMRYFCHDHWCLVSWGVGNNNHRMDWHLGTCWRGTHTHRRSEDTLCCVRYPLRWGLARSRPPEPSNSLWVALSYPYELSFWTNPSILLLLFFFLLSELVLSFISFQTLSN